MTTAPIATLKGEAGKVLQPEPDFRLAMDLNRIGDESESRRKLVTAESSLDKVGVAIDRESWMFDLLRRQAVALTTSGRADRRE